MQAKLTRPEKYRSTLRLVPAFAVDAGCTPAALDVKLVDELEVLPEFVVPWTLVASARRVWLAVAVVDVTTVLLELEASSPFASPHVFNLSHPFSIY